MVATGNRQRITETEMTTLVEFSEHESHCLLFMDDGKANALSFDMFEALNDGLDRSQAAGKVVVIGGRPGRFSAGFHLPTMAQGGEVTLKLLREGADLSARLMAFPTPVVLAVSGHALAMGALMCLSADYRIGVLGNYKIGLNEVAIGMTLPWFGVELARARLARTHFNQAVGLARIYDPQGAVEAGFLDEAVDEGSLQSRAEEMAQALAALDMKSHVKSKQRVREEFFALYEAALQKDFDAGEVLGA
jgi:enoyl-CoA hydratase